MKITLYAMALFSAFFVSSNEGEYNPDSLIPAKNEQVTGYTECYKLITDRYPLYNSRQSITIIQGTDASACLENTWQGVGAYAGISYTFDTQNVTRNDANYQYVDFNFKADENQSTAWKNNVVAMGARVYKTQSSDFYSCPPDGNPLHTIAVGSGSSMMCGKPIGTPEPDPSDCDEFGTNSFLPPNDSLNVPAGGSVCYTTASGSQCKFKQNPFGSGFEQTGEQCTGEEPIYPKPDIAPPDNADNPNACATVGSTDPYAICPVNPNDVCNRIIVAGDGGDKIMNQCPAGCGSVD
ncbi:hypothetical protein, partial [Pseudoalteromonas sp. T1lg21]|uniref:hypothetical protein n=1 Tax=Pseudoalteromonas sp. T1lg21 TaxID=2077095 RepID=UPI0018F8702D